VADARAKTLARAMAVSRPSSRGRRAVLIRINPNWRFKVHQLRKIVWFQRTTELWNYIAVESVKIVEILYCLYSRIKRRFILRMQSELNITNLTLYTFTLF